MDGAALFLIGVGVGYIAQEIWREAIELLDIWRNGG